MECNRYHPSPFTLHPLIFRVKEVKGSTKGISIAEAINRIYRSKLNKKLSSEIRIGNEVFEAILKNQSFDDKK